MIQIGKIIQIKDQQIRVQLLTVAECSDCTNKASQTASCPGCALFKPKNQPVLQLNRPSASDYRVGDLVEIEIQSKKAIGAAFMFFILPLLIISFTYLGLSLVFPELKEAFKILLSLLSLGLALLIIIIWQKKTALAPEGPQIIGHYKNNYKNSF